MILDKLIGSTKKRVAEAKERVSPSELIKRLDKAELRPPRFRDALIGYDGIDNRRDKEGIALQGTYKTGF